MYCVENEKRKQVHCEGIDLGDGVVIEEADEEGYKYLGILERVIFVKGRWKKRFKKNIINESGQC